MKNLLLLAILSLTLSACLTEELQKLPSALIGTHQNGNATSEISALNLGLRKGNGLYRLRFQIFRDRADQAPLIATLTFRENANDRIGISLPNSAVIELKIQGSCAINKTEQIQICWSPSELILEGFPLTGKMKLRAMKSEDFSKPGSKSWTLTELLGRARLQSFISTSSTERIYRAKETVLVKRGNLLPSFNLRDAISFTLEGPLGLIGGVGEVLPFLFPKNWFAWSQSKEMYQAELLSFASTISNQMNAVETMVYAIQRDAALQKRTVEIREKLVGLHRKAKYFEEQGIYPPWVAREIQIELSRLESDLRSMDRLIAMERGALASAVALSPVDDPIEEILLTPRFEPVDLSDFKSVQRAAHGQSLELASFTFLKNAAELGVKAEKFGFLDPSGLLRFSFADAHEINIAKSHVREIEGQKRHMQDLLDQRLSDLQASVTEAVHLKRIAEEGIKTVHARVRELVDLPLEQGELVWSEDTLDRTLRLYEKLLSFQVQLDSAEFAMAIQRSNFDRLMGEGFYAGLNVVDLPKVD